MTHFERSAVDTTRVEDRVEAIVRRNRGSETQVVVAKVHKRAPDLPPAVIRAAIWDLVGRGRITIGFDSSLDVPTAKLKNAATIPKGKATDSTITSKAPKSGAKKAAQER